MSGLRIFQNREFGAVRVIEHKGEPWFVARDVCAVLGTETRDLPDILEHDEQRPIVDIIHTLNDSTGLRRDSRIISEPGLYSLVLRSRKPEAKAFKRWIVHEVIPSIRRTGGYGAPALPNFRNPAEAARAWADKEEQRLLEEQKRLALEQKMEEVKPKVVFAESIEVAKTSILVGEMAKLIKQATGYDIGQNRFFEWLRSRGYLHKDGSRDQHAYPEKHGCRMDGDQGGHPHRKQWGKPHHPHAENHGQGANLLHQPVQENGGVMIIRCRHRIPSPEAVGFLTVEGLREAAAQYPHLRPCKKHGWNWLYRTACAKCGDKVEVPLEGSAREHEKGPLWSNGPKGEKMMQVHQNVENSMPAIGSAVKGKV